MATLITAGIIVGIIAFIVGILIFVHNRDQRKAANEKIDLR